LQKKSPPIGVHSPPFWQGFGSQGSAKVVVVTLTVVVDEVVVVIVVLVVLVVVLASQGHESDPEPPTAMARHTSASVADTGSVPFGAHAHSCSHDAAPTATLRM